MSYWYWIHVVPPAMYATLVLNSPFKGGTVVNGLAGLGDDCLIVTAHLRPTVEPAYNEPLHSGA